MKQLLLFSIAAVVFGQLVSVEDDDDMQEVIECVKTFYCNSTQEWKDLLHECMETTRASGDVVLPCHPGKDTYTIEDTLEHLCEADDEEAYEVAKCEQDAIDNSEVGEEISDNFEEAIDCFIQKVTELEDEDFSNV